MTQEKSWHGKVAIVTGGSSGIGRATAMSLVEKGARVLVTGRDSARLAVMDEAGGAMATLQADSAEPAGAAGPHRQQRRRRPATARRRL